MSVDKYDLTQYSKGKNKYSFDYNGVPISLDFTHSGQSGDNLGYEADNIFRNNNREQVAVAAALLLQKGSMPSKEEMSNGMKLAGVKSDISDWDYTSYKSDLIKFVKNNKGALQYDGDGEGLAIKGLTNAAMDQYEINPADIQTYGDDGTVDNKDAAFNDYYNDWYSLDEGSNGKRTLDELTTGYQDSALASANLADATYQSAAMSQAAIVKSATDKIKSERMARLKAGMSTSQIANQDMQSLMTNVSALNETAQMQNQLKLEAQSQYGLAQSNAYNDYLKQAQAQGTVASSMAAGDAGNAAEMAKKYSGLSTTKQADYKTVAGITD